MYHRQPHDFKNRLLGKVNLIRNALFLFSTDVRSHNPPFLGPNSSLRSHIQLMWDLTIYLLESPTLHFVPLSNRCGISQSTPLEGPTLHFVPLSNLCGISQSTPLRAQHYASFLSQIDVGSHNLPLEGPTLRFVPLSNRCGISQSTPLRASVPHLYTLQPMISQIHPIGGLGFHTLKRNALFPSQTDVPLGGSTSSLAHRPVTDFDTIFNSLSPSLVNIFHPCKGCFVPLSNLCAPEGPNVLARTLPCD